MQPPPKDTSPVTFLDTCLLFVKIYKASGLGIELILFITTSKFEYVNIGITGPNISSCIIGSEKSTRSNTVGSICRL